MLLVDTNVVSEMRKVRSGRAEPNFGAWIRATDPARLFLSAIVVEELEIGVLRLERRDPTQGALLRRWLDGEVLHEFAGRIFPVDIAVARRAAALHVPDPRPHADALIAATALVHGLTIVTRNRRDFAPMGVAILDPWQGPTA